MRLELESCKDLEGPNFSFSKINESTLSFIITMISSIDNEKYIIEVKLDDYKELPPNLEFIDPSTGQSGTKNAYPVGSDSFFHGYPCICNPCSRKAYGNVHQDWGLANWQENKDVNTLTNLKAILQAIYFRINDSSYYKGRMR